MTALVDAIERAFWQARADVMINGGEARADTVADAIQLYCKAESSDGLEAIVYAAYDAAMHMWGNEWMLYSGDVAELVVDGLRDWVASS